MHLVWNLLIRVIRVFRNIKKLSYVVQYLRNVKHRIYCHFYRCHVLSLYSDIKIVYSLCLTLLENYNSCNQYFRYKKDCWVLLHSSQMKLISAKKNKQTLFLFCLFQLKIYANLQEIQISKLFFTQLFGG